MSAYYINENGCRSRCRDKKCKRKDGRIFSLHLPRKFTRKRCMKKMKGFTMRSSSAPLQIR